MAITVTPAVNERTNGINGAAKNSYTRYTAGPEARLQSQHGCLRVAPRQRRQHHEQSIMYRSHRIS
ncbi:MAG: hypothetical protein P8O91_06990 [Luminiphilus sp.]|nr:hypothetical protein [Luminiphilus sp.]